MQFRGDMFQSWTLTAFASRTLVSLNYHTTQKNLASNETEQGIQLSLVTCYYLDKILSMLLIRPPSLPKLRINPAELVPLDPLLPLSAILKAVVGFARVQEEAIDILLKTQNIDDKCQVAIIDRLVQEMFQLHTRLQEVRDLS